MSTIIAKNKNSHYKTPLKNMMMIIMMIMIIWVLVSNIFYFYPYLGKIPMLTNIFQTGWNHKLVMMLMILDILVVAMKTLIRCLIPFLAVPVTLDSPGRNKKRKHTDI